MVNEFSSAEFMETHYHSQFDNDEYYNADVFRFHHELYGLLVMAFDRVKVVPVNVGRTLQALQESVRPGSTIISWPDLNEIGRALIRTYVLGLEGIRDSYGEITII